MPDEETSASETPHPYQAFISYSRKDNRGDGQCWGDWLQTMVQSFQIPQPFVGRSTNEGVLGMSVGDVFLDRTDLGVGDMLTDAIRKKLRQSRFLLVIGSPASAKSRWVGLEIEEFVRFHGGEKVLLLAIDGEVEQDWVHPNYYECLHLEKVKTYIEFRATRRHGNGAKYRVRGWTDTSGYAYTLKKEDIYNLAEIRRQVSDYERDHRDAIYRLMAALTGLRPRDLSGQGAMDEVKRHRLALLRMTMIAVVMLALAGVALSFYGKSEKQRRFAEEQRLRAERSLKMIGDAHERTFKLVADVLVDLREKLRASGEEKASDGARRIVSEYLDENQPSGDDDDSIHMRSVVLNSRGYLARRAGDFNESERFYAEALRLRRALASRDPDKAMFQHNVAVSLDNFGDLHALKGEDVARKGGDKRVEYARALVFYRDSLAISEKLAAMKDAAPSWRHDVPVSLFKIGAALFQGGDPDAALKALQQGLPVAEAVAASDPDYATWQAHLGLYCLEIGRLHAAGARFDEARPILTRGKSIFTALRAKNRLTAEYGDWLALIEGVLRDVSE